MIEKFVLNEMQKVMYDDALLTSHSVYQTTNQTEEITSVFDVISYKKGASMLRMLNELIGHKTFKQGLTRYLKTLYAYSSFHLNDSFPVLYSSLDFVNIQGIP